MKYDRPVWQLMHACADAMPETFRYEDVRTWFAENYPEVGDATIRAHVVGLTDGGAKHPQFQRRSPLFRRVSRGVYAPIPLEERGELPEGSDDDTAAPIRFTVVGPPDEPEPHLGQDDSAEEFWPFPAEPRVRDDAMAKAAAARRKRREKEDRRRRKAARREAERLEVERARRDQGEAQGSAPEPENQPEDMAAAREVQMRRALDLEQVRREAQHEVDAERQRLAAERAEMTQIAARRDETSRHAEEEIAAERSRLHAERAEAQRLIQDRSRADAEARSSDQLAVVRAEAERMAAAQAEAGRLTAERVEAERIAAEEKKRASKVRKAARKEREVAEMLERDRFERKARRKAERRAREHAEQHLRDAADRRRREDEGRKVAEGSESRRVAEGSVRDELARLETEALARLEAERSMRARSEFERAERDRHAFEASERDRVESEQLDREERERQQLEREEDQLQMTLRPMLDDEPLSSPDTTTGDDPLGGHDATGDADDPFTSHGGIVIVRAQNSPFGQQGVMTGADPRWVTPEPAVQEHDLSAPDDRSGLSVRDDEDRATRRDAIVLGSGGERLRVPAPARDAFRDVAFQRARREAELSGARWFVLSAEHGLLEPQEWMSPDERSVDDIEPRQRAAWATWVVARLESLVGDLPGQVVEVEAPEVIAAPVLAALRDAGATAVLGHAGHDEAGHEEAGHDEAGEVSTIDDPDLDDPEPVSTGSTVEPTDPRSVVDGSEERPYARVLPFLRGASIPSHLSDARQTVPAASAAALPHHPGLYAWTVDHIGSRDLNRALRLPVRAGVIYVGQVGGSTGLSDGGFSLNEHITRVQLHGRARASTFRMTLATALAGFLGLHTIEDPRLTQWMLDHLSVSVWPTDDVASLHELKAAVVEQLQPALNVDRDHSTEYRDRIAELRGRLA